MPPGEIMVIYRCWGCGSVKIEYEPQDEPIPAKEVWNLCEECQEKSTHTTNTD